jgi:putative hemolysin
MQLSIPILSIIISLLLIGLLAGIEMAFVSVNKLSIDLNKKQGTYTGKVWSGFAENPSKFIGALLVASTILMVIYGLFIGKLLSTLWSFAEPIIPTAAEKYIGFFQVIFETLLSTFILLFVIYLIKPVFKARNNNLVNNNTITYVASFFNNAFSSISMLFVGMAEWILKYVLNVKVSNKKELFSKVDLEHYMQQNKMHNEEESNSEINKELFDNALSLSEVRLRECLVPRKEIVSISQTSTIAEVKKMFIETQLSKLVVFDNNIDSITGYIHQLDLFKGPSTIKEILLPIPTVPETMSATDLMTKFGKERKSIAWVIDEFGGTAGIVTMEDLLEEIFGDIKDEYDDAEEFVDKQLAENEYLFSGRLELDVIAQKYGLVFSEEENAETLSGYIVQHNENIPKEKERIIIGNYEFSIMSMSDTKIETVKLKVLRVS